MAALSTQALDDGWVLDARPETADSTPAVAPAPKLTLVADPGPPSGELATAQRARHAAETVDDGWCLDDGWVLDEPTALAVAEAVARPAEPALAVVADGDDEAFGDRADGWSVEPDERAPSMELSAAEAAFFATGEALVHGVARVESFDDLESGPAPSFWQRLWRRRR